MTMLQRQLKEIDGLMQRTTYIFPHVISVWAWLLGNFLSLGPEPLMFWVIPHHHFLNVYLGKVLTTFYSVVRGGSLQTMAVWAWPFRSNNMSYPTAGLFSQLNTPVSLVLWRTEVSVCVSVHGTLPVPVLRS